MRRALVAGIGFCILLAVMALPSGYAQQVKRVWPYANTLHTCAISPTFDELCAGDSGLVILTHWHFLDGTAGTPGWYTYLNRTVSFRASVIMDSERAVVGGTKGAIEYTSDGGDYWYQVASHTTSTVRALASNGSGIILCVGDSGLIERSTDYGHTWKRLASPVSAQLNSVAFGTPSYGIAVGNDTTIIQSTDSGKTWTQMLFPYDLRPLGSAISRVDFSAVAISGTDSVWVGLERPVMPLLIIRGGIDTNATLSPFPNSGPITSLLYIGAKDLSLMAFAPDDYQYECRPSKGWTQQRVAWPEDADGTADSGHLRTRCAAIGKRTDGEWGIITVGDDLQEYLSWRVGSSANPDSVVSWIWNSLPGNDYLIEWIQMDSHHSIVDYHDSVLFGVGGQGEIWESTDRGITWLNVFSTPLGYGRFAQPSLSSVCRIDSLSALAAGWAGLILRSSDRGTTWDTIPSGTLERLHDIAFPTPDNGIIVGDYGLILRSTDTGTSWASIPNTYQDFLWSVAFATDQTGIAVGDSGRILRTVDAGLHWSDVNNVLSGTTYSIRQVQAFPDSILYARANSLLLRSTDLGQNWQFVNLPEGDSLGMNFYNSSIGIVVEGTATSEQEPDTAFIAYTLDAGVHWKELPVPIWNNHRVLSHWLNDHQVLLYGTAGFMVQVDLSTSGVKITLIDPPSDLRVYPNPSSGTVHVNYSTSSSGLVTIQLFSEDGKDMGTLFSGTEPAGTHEQSLTAPAGLQGTYFIKVSAGGTSAAAKLTLE